MQSIDGRIVYSATDLVGFVECGHLADLERAAAEGHLEKPMREDKVLDRIAQRGLEHEARFLRDLDGAGRGVRDLTIPNDSPLAWPERVREHAGLTVEAMRDGVDVIYQATFFDGGRLGFVDFLRRVETPSPTFGAWSYEVWDTKLARHAKASAVLQLCFYSDMLTTLQGVAPESMHLALGGKQQEKVTFRVADYAAYYRSVARDLEVELGGSEVFPVISMAEPVEHCEVCRWSERCSREWRERDDLSLVAGITSRQRRALHAADVPTRTGLASLDLPTPARLPEINAAALERIQKQAEIQVRGERAHATIFELIDPTLTTRDGTIPPNYGLAMLPPPSPGDLFFDIEGDPFFGTDEIDGIDYLFGVIEPGRRDAAGQPMFHDFWAIEDGEISPALERRAFEAFIDLVMERLRQDPGLHVYHYAPYEPTAVKRLAGRYGTREDEVDTLLRGNVFVDLYRAVRQGIRASVESYSIKKLEPLYSFTRDVAMRDANTIIVEFETWLELGGDPARALAIIGDIRAYNRDDCVSTWRLRDWLEVQRTALEAQLGQDIPRAHYEVPEERELSETRQATVELVTRLTSGLPDDLGEANDAERGRWLLAQLLDWHRREEKSTWWRYFSLAKDYTDEERRDLPDTLGCLEATGEIGKVRKSTIYRFSFPPQEHKFSVGDAPHDPLTFKGAGTIEAINDETGTIDIARSSGSEAPTPTSLIPLDIVRAAPKPEALNRLADWVLDHGIEAVGEHRAGRDLLMRVPPRLGQQAGAPLAADGEDIQAAARRLVMGLDASYLAIQGPPGSGKSSVGAQMIVDLVAAGKRVGVTANSHKVIGELLQKVDTVAAGRGVAVQIGHRNDEPPYAGARVVSNNEARSGLADGTLDVVGGTAWLWAREEMARSVDVLFIDEAGRCRWPMHWPPRRERTASYCWATRSSLRR